MSYWKKTSFWGKIRDTVQILGTSTQLTLIFNDAQHIYNVIVAATQLLSLLLPVWFTDEDRDGNVDAFQEEVKVIVKSETPVDVQITKEEIKS